MSAGKPPPGPPRSKGPQPFNRTTLLLWLALVLVGGIAVVFLTTDYLSEIAREAAFQAILTEQNSGPQADDTHHVDIGTDPNPLRFAVAPVLSPEASLLLYDDLVDTIGKRLSKPALLLLQGSYQETNQMLLDGECELAMICTMSFVLVQRAIGIRPVAVPQIDGQLTYHSLVIVPKESAARSLDDLKGMRFASADRLSTTGWLYPAVSLIRKERNPDTFFAEVLVVGSHDRALAAVASGDADAAAIHSQVYRRSDELLRSRVKVIDQSPPFGMPPIVAHSSLPDATYSTVQKVLVELDSDQAGVTLLNSLGFERFVVPPPGHYDSVAELVDQWEAYR